MYTIQMCKEIKEPQPEHGPNCPDQGWYAVWDQFSGEPMQEQCEFCYTVENSVFNLNQNKA